VLLWNPLPADALYQAISVYKLLILDQLRAFNTSHPDGQALLEKFQSNANPNANFLTKQRDRVSEEAIGPTGPNLTRLTLERKDPF
jgi:hypothetical protein